MRDWGYSKIGTIGKELNRKKMIQEQCEYRISDIDKLQVKKLTHFLVKDLRPMWRSFAAAHACVQASVCARLCV